MGRSRYKEAQIIAAMKQVQAGRTLEDVARECGVSHATLRQRPGVMSACARSARSSVGSPTRSAHAGGLRTGRRNTTNNVHTAASATELRLIFLAWL